jgi:hypothetical protein
MPYIPYDDLLNNPCELIYGHLGRNFTKRENDPSKEVLDKLYGWHHKVRIIDANNNISKIGKSYHGTILIDGVEHEVANTNKYVILDKTLKYLKEAGIYKQYKNKLYELITLYRKNRCMHTILTYPCNKYRGQMNLSIEPFPTSIEEYEQYPDTPHDGIDSWAYVDPDVKFTKKEMKSDKNVRRWVSEADRNARRIRDVMFPILHVLTKDLSTCTKLNPTPPCGDGYHEKLNKKGDVCCYKTKKKTTNR